MNKPYILSSFDHAFEARRYFWSMGSAIGEGITPVSIMYEPHVDLPEFPKHGKLIRASKKYPGNTGRHRDMHEVIAAIEKDLDTSQWFFFTDVHDVIFQCPLPELPEDADILVCYEGKTFGEIEFWRGLIPKNMWEWKAYNCGTMAMRYDVLVKYWNYVDSEWMKFFTWYKDGMLPKLNGNTTFPFESPTLDYKIKFEIAKMYNEYHDTVAYNRFIHDNTYRIREVPGLFTCYAFDYELGNIVERDGKTYTKDGLLISITHYNGSSKEFMRKEEPYVNDHGENQGRA